MPARVRNDLYRVYLVLNVRLPGTPSGGPAGVPFILRSNRGALLRRRRPSGVELFVALFDAASPLVPGNGGADMVRASALACSSDFLLCLAGCQSKDLIAQVRRAAPAASWYCGRGPNKGSRADKGRTAELSVN